MDDLTLAVAVTLTVAHAGSSFAGHQFFRAPEDDLVPQAGIVIGLPHHIYGHGQCRIRKVDTAVLGELIEAVGTVADVDEPSAATHTKPGILACNDPHLLVHGSLLVVRTGKGAEGCQYNESYLYYLFHGPTALV